MSDYRGLLIAEPPLQVLPSLALIVGLNEAIFLQQVHYWVQKNEERGKNRWDGYTWTYNSYKGWQTNFPFWSPRTIERTVTSLEDQGVLISAQRRGPDRRKWYRLNYERLRQLEQVAASRRQIDGMSVDCQVYGAEAAGW